VYIGDGEFRQFRNSKNANKDGRVVTRGWLGYMIKEGREIQFFQRAVSIQTIDSLSITNIPDNIEILLHLGLKCFLPDELDRDLPAIAKGSYGIVYKGKAKSLGEKTIVIKDMFTQNPKSVKEWSTELETMTRSKSKYVAEIFGFTSLENVLIIVMDYFPQGDLYNTLHKQKVKINDMRRLIMSRQVLCGLNHLHKLEVLHRDIKSMNILLTQDFSCKITDFGMSKLITSDMEIRHTCTAGTPLWMAPEVKTGVYGYPADIYSTGLVIYEIIEQKLPEYDRQNSHIILPSHLFPLILFYHWYKLIPY